MGNALAPGGDEGRGKLRKCAGRCKRPMIRACPNGATCHIEDMTKRRKPSELKHLSRRRKIKQVVIPQVVASESGGGQTDGRARRGCRTAQWTCSA
jgi:hypothetical protein